MKWIMKVWDYFNLMGSREKARITRLQCISFGIVNTFYGIWTFGSSIRRGCTRVEGPG